MGEQKFTMKFGFRNFHQDLLYVRSIFVSIP